MLTQRSGIQAAEGTVVLGGLGLGWLLRKAGWREYDRQLAAAYRRYRSSADLLPIATARKKGGV
jgi:hypothetical protein